jgi:hypothetical protein
MCVPAAPLTLTLSPLRGEGIGGAVALAKPCDLPGRASPSPLNGERAGVRGEAGRWYQPDAPITRLACVRGLFFRALISWN